MCSRCFFFSSRRRHTRCSRDWSSDVCSSDLSRARTAGWVFTPRDVFELKTVRRLADVAVPLTEQDDVADRDEIGRASCRERVEISVVAVSLKKKKLEV